MIALPSPPRRSSPRLRCAVNLHDVANGVFKSFYFALIIGIVSCHQGLTTLGGPRGIGRSVTKAVVNSIVLIVIFDYLLTRTLYEMMSAPASHNSGVSLQVHGLRKSFGELEVLKGIDFEVQPGEIFVIMGPSGSGKSVLLKHLIGLEPPDEGEILINGESIQSPEIAENTGWRWSSSRGRCSIRSPWARMWGFI